MLSFRAGVGQVTAFTLVIPLTAGCLAQGPTSPVGGGEAEGKATTTPAVDIVSDQPLSDRQLASLAGIAENIHGDPPRATVERQIQLDETVELTNQCMTESGFVVIDGAIEVPPEQEQAYWQAMYLCLARYPVMDQYLQPLTEEQWTIRYEHWTGELLPGLAGEGIYPDQEPPSLATFLGNTSSWRPGVQTIDGVSAWRERTGLDEEDLAARCPEEPPSDVLFAP